MKTMKATQVEARREELMALQLAHRREATAAVILAALCTDRMYPEESQQLDDVDRRAINYAVLLTDALQEKLSEK